MPVHEDPCPAEIESHCPCQPTRGQHARRWHWLTRALAMLRLEGMERPAYCLLVLLLTLGTCGAQTSTQTDRESWLAAASDTRAACRGAALAAAPGSCTDVHLPCDGNI